jgi:hypothetical protein
MFGPPFARKGPVRIPPIPKPRMGKPRKHGLIRNRDLDIPNRRPLLVKVSWNTDKNPLEAFEAFLDPSNTLPKG